MAAAESVIVPAVLFTAEMVVLAGMWGLSTVCPTASPVVEKWAVVGPVGPPSAYPADSHRGLTLPFRRTGILIPRAASNCSTSTTRTLIPRMQGLPPHCSGSIVIRASSSDSRISETPCPEDTLAGIRRQKEPSRNDSSNRRDVARR